MKFEIGKYYRHTMGEVVHIIAKVDTFFHGECLLAESDSGNLMPFGQDEQSAVNWVEVPCWEKETYLANGIEPPK